MFIPCARYMYENTYVFGKSEKRGDREKWINSTGNYVMPLQYSKFLNKLQNISLLSATKSLWKRNLHVRFDPFVFSLVFRTPANRQNLVTRISRNFNLTDRYKRRLSFSVRLTLMAVRVTVPLYLPRRTMKLRGITSTYRK